MQILCTTCETELTEDGPCPACGATARGYRYGPDDIVDGRIKAPPHMFAEREVLPDWYTGSGWLWVDDAHQSEDGAPAYRTVFKTIRRPIIRNINLDWPNLRVRFWHGSVKVGATTLTPATPWRKERHSVVLEWGSLGITDDSYSYQPLRLSSATLDTKETEHTGGSFIEFIVTTEAAKPADQIAEGRRILASLVTIIDLTLGPRVLGVRLTEEIGKIFDDGHFLCSGQSESVGMESLLTVEPLFMEQLYGWSQFVINRHMGRTDEDRTRLSLASEWYQLANSTADPVLEFIYLWLVVEVMAMSTPNIRPAREQLILILGEEVRLGQLLGRLYGTRSRILHHGLRTITLRHLEALRDIVLVLLEHDLGWVNLARRERLLLASRSIQDF